MYLSTAVSIFLYVVLQKCYRIKIVVTMKKNFRTENVNRRIQWSVIVSSHECISIGKQMCNFQYSAFNYRSMNKISIHSPIIFFLLNFRLIAFEAYTIFLFYRYFLLIKNFLQISLRKIRYNKIKCLYLVHQLARRLSHKSSAGRR